MRLKIYIASYEKGYELCYPLDEKDFETLNLLINGAPRLESWIPLPMKIIRRDRKVQLMESDAPWCESHALIFKPAVIQKLGSVLKNYGELLPLNCPGEDLVVLNVTNILDALNIENSDVTRFSTGKIMMIRKYEFRPEIVGKSELFKIPDVRVSPTFASQNFVDRWQASGFKGLDFELVWSSM